jgi:hypothetical protein
VAAFLNRSLELLRNVKTGDLFVKFRVGQRYLYQGGNPDWRIIPGPGLKSPLLTAPTKAPRARGIKVVSSK